ncbi:hypothetical protein EDD22DRAFT_845209 [Suillus occidentalis]|nr:hypothetical protein EDD22DRAFT_845209 [Suillus occidentalis]
MLLKMLIHTVNNSTFQGQSFNTPPWTGPSSTQIWVQSLIYASLSASLLAALGAMLGKQWLGHFQHFGHGTVDGRGRQRQRKLDALYAWHFNAVLEGLPVLLQLSLLLFGVALGANLWTQQHIVACIVIGTTSFGTVFYALIVVAALISDHVVLFHNALQKGNQTILSSFLRFVSYIPYITITSLHSFVSCISRRLSSQYAIENTDAPCIRWLLETSDNPDVITTAASLVPEVEWPPDLDVSCALLRLRDTFLDCFENTQYGQPKLSDFGRDLLDVGISIPISLGNPKIPNTFLMWMSHPLLHCLSANRYARFWRRRALDVVERLLVSPLPPTNVLANCLMAAGLLLDQPVDLTQLASTNKGSSIRTLLVSVLESMQQAIGIDIHLELRERSSVYALKLLRPLAAVLEVEQFRQTAYDLGMPDWGVRLCQSLVNIVLHHPELCRPEARDKAWVAARDALHFSVITAGNGDSGPTDDRITWKEEIVSSPHD